MNRKPGQPTAFDLFIAFDIVFHRHEVDDYHALNSARMQFYSNRKDSPLEA